jgi:hypothetical protein
LSTAPFVAYIWQFGNQEWQSTGYIDPLLTSELEDFKDYLRAGGGHVYYGMFNFNLYPGIEDPLNTTFEAKVNAACIRLTERFHPFSGEIEKTLRAGKCYGMDAANYYIGDLGQEGRVTGVVNWDGAVNWWAARFCGAERGEYAGASPFGPHDLEIPDNPLELPDWLSSYRTDFDETPFYWFCGLQTFLTFKFPVADEGEPYGAFSVGWQKMPIIDDTSQKVWAYLTPTERFAFIMDWINGTGNPLEEVKVGAYIMSKNCKAQRYLPWKPHTNLDTTKEFNDNWRRFRIPTNVVPRCPGNLAEARLVPLMVNNNDCAYGKWKALFIEFLEDMVDYADNNPNVIFFSDQESKDMVVQQYDNSVTVDQDRIELIAAYLADQDNWQINEPEWGDTNKLITRPPNNVRIEIDEHVEYYSLSEAWWYLMAALYDLENGESIQERTLEPIIGPYEPHHVEYTLENAYRVWEWKPNAEFHGHQFQFAYIKKSCGILYDAASTDMDLGPEYTPEVISQQTRLLPRKRVKAFWAVHDVNGFKTLANAAEMLWLMAKGLDNYFNSIPNNIPYLPSHVLPKYFYKMSQVKVYPLTNQHNWFDLTQLWTMKPAVLQPAYR